MFFGFGKRARRQRLAGTFPAAWQDHLRDGVLYYALLAAAEQARLRDIAHVLIVEKQWEGCAGQTVTDEVKVVIAAQAALLLLGISDYYFDELDSILVYPGGYLGVGETEFGEEGDAEMRLGEAMHGGPIALGWWHSRWAGRRLGHVSVVLHEFAHKLAELGDATAGRPPLLDRSLWKRWDRVMSRERERLAEDDGYGRPTLLDPYGATDANEFFAVATETFFLRAAALKRRHPDVYELLAAFYRQDPASRAVPPEVAARARELDEEYDRQVIAECTAALKARPDFTEAYSSRAGYRLALGDLDGAEADWTAVLRQARGEERAEALYERAAVRRDAGREEEALIDLTAALGLCPDFAAALVERGAIFAEQGQDAAAMADFDAAVRLDERDDAAWAARADAHRRAGRHELALADLDRAVGLSPHDADLLLERAGVLEELGRLDDAARDRGRAEVLGKGDI